MVFLIAAVALALVSLRPRVLPEWVGPVSGVTLLLLLGDESLTAAVTAVARQWNVLLFILGLMVLSAAAEESGAFAWIAAVLLERGRGSRRRLFVLLFLTGALLTAVLSNDATAVVFTPIVYRAVAKRGGDVLPFLFACTFVADTASFGLPFANPANIVVLPHPHILAYLWHLGPPQLAAVAINLLLFLVVFRQQLRGRYEYDGAGTAPPIAVRTLAVMGCVVAAYIAALTLEWPLGPVAVIGGLTALAAARVTPARAVRHLGLGTFVLLAGLFALLDAVGRAGFVGWALHGLEGAAQYGHLAVIAIAGGGAALTSNLLNNLPVAVASSYLVVQAPSEHLAYPLIVGVDLGPNLTTSGSLATILWLAVLRARGVRIDALQYARLGALVVPPTIAVTVLWLWLVG